MKVLVDGLNNAYRCLVYQLVTSYCKKVGVIYGMLTLVKSYYFKFGVVPIIVWDGKAKFRREINKNYKLNRIYNNDVALQVEDLKEIFSLLGITQYYNQDYECDDVIACLCKKFTSDSIVIISTDNDFYQLVNERVFIFDPSQGVMLNEESIKCKTGISPSKFVFYRVLVGDFSDNIKGIPRIRKSDVCSLVTKYSNLDELYNRIDEVRSYPLKQNLVNYKETVYNNYNIIRFRDEITLMEIEKKVDIEKAKQLFTKYEFKKFLDNFSFWEKVSSLSK